jgi:pyruvate kinase
MGMVAVAYLCHQIHPCMPYSRTSDHAQILVELSALRDEMVKAEERYATLLTTVSAPQRISAQNLIHYLTFRSHDVRSLQDRLHALGLSSMASSESHVLAQLEQIMLRLGWDPAGDTLSPCGFPLGSARIEDHTFGLFGPRLDESVPHIMVTLESSSGTDIQGLQGALMAGMTIARINCAHDGPEDWAAWIHNLREASGRTGRPCRIYMDLPGPKMRMSLVSGFNEKGNLRIEPGDEILLLDEPADLPPDVMAIACQEKGVIGQLKAGSRVVIDDGKYEGDIIRDERGCLLRITRVRGKKPKLQNEKGLNFPYADLEINVLTESDKALLPFMAAHADLVGCSFIRTPEDVRAIRAALSAFPRRPDLILKIETPEAVINLPELLLAGMEDDVIGVMIARGDLAVEIGFQQLSDIQDKILWICEAAHVPVIWATQVLESLNKFGLATRSEITDAAHAFKAECVMLNKGEYMQETLAVLTDVLRRAGGHRRKKRYTLRPLTVAREFVKRHRV